MECIGILVDSRPKPSAEFSSVLSVQLLAFCHSYPGHSASNPVSLQTGVHRPLPTAHCPVVAVDPCEYAGWDALLEQRGDASFFHGSAWARVLHETYGHKPVYFCRVDDAGRLVSLLAVMEVCSAVTGRRGVGLPFTDVCGPLGSGESKDAAELFDQALQHGREQGWRYLECRGNIRAWPGAWGSVAFHGHVVDLSEETERMFQALESSVRRGIRKAEQSEVKVEFSNNAELMDVYYGLHCQTRRRHGVPPQPKRFFDNIARFVLGAGRGFVAVARKDSRPMAAAVYFHAGREATYKFGASDFAFQSLRPNNLVMWESMKRLASLGCKYLHMGRTSLQNEGLRRFKLGFGAREDRIEYARYDFRKAAFAGSLDRAEGWANSVFRLLPATVLRMVGTVVYPHLS